MHTPGPATFTLTGWRVFLALDDQSRQIVRLFRRTAELLYGLVQKLDQTAGALAAVLLDKRSHTLGPKLRAVGAGPLE
jgi:hypothetical protein